MSTDEYMLGQVRERFAAQQRAQSAKMAHYDKLDAMRAERDATKAREWDRELERLDDTQSSATAVLLGTLESFLAKRCVHGTREDTPCRQCDPTVSIAPRGGWNPKLGPPNPPPMPFKQFA